jgi:hypothetical protein
MRRALRPNRSRRQVVGEPKTVPAPYKGWYTLESDTQMPKGSAKILDNWWPEADSASVRKGQLDRSTGMPGPVKTVMAYRSGTNSKFFAASVDGIYDITTPGPVGARKRVLTEGFCSYTNCATSGGQFLMIVNGADAPVKYDGTNFTAIAIADGGPSNLNDLNFVWQYRARIYFLAKDSTVFYFLPADSIGGTLGTFDVGASLTKGGKLVAAGRWTVDAGNGPDDLMVVVSDQGELIVYNGRDPADANSWSNVGIFSVGKPVGPRCLRNIGGDLVLICEDGAVPLSTIIRFDRAQQKKAAATSNIAKAFNEVIRQRGRGKPWGVFLWATGTMLICNLPGRPAVAEQYVMNVQTGAWARFTGIDALCWEEFDDKPYFGTPDGRVVEFWHGSTDNGKPIKALAMPAFSNLGYSGLKTNSLMRMNMVTSDQLSIKVGLVTDYDVVLRNLIAIQFDDAESLWDLSPWDTTPWADEDTERVQGWQDAPGVGYTFAPVVVVETIDHGPDYEVTCRLISFDLVGPNGGIL